MADEHITKEQREQLAEAIRKLGIVEVAKRLGLARESVARVAGNFGSQAGTEALAAARMGRLE